ncbi:hypothetical protein PIB30_053823 [Stylosanthes scabra]|uniref:Uncharacterized protein n=1 Tax=Stylosanthes scabra TaxID=79078 RepID=A0ABU6SIR6_9FABA|nr:hypothetical protein [Stylosanthes scabra]
MDYSSSKDLGPCTSELRRTFGTGLIPPTRPFDKLSDNSVSHGDAPKSLRSFGLSTGKCTGSYQSPHTTTLQLCTDGYYRRPRSTDCTNGSAVGISNRAVGKIMAKLEGKLALRTDGIIISRQTAQRWLNNTDGSAVDEAAVVRSGCVVAFSDDLAVGNDSDGLAVS